MANVRTFVKNVKPYCREHGLMEGWDPDNFTFYCKTCEVATGTEEIQKNCYAPHFYEQKNPFIEFK